MAKIVSSNGITSSFSSEFERYLFASMKFTTLLRLYAQRRRCTFEGTAL